jgi:hypothetical protein
VTTIQDLLMNGFMIYLNTNGKYTLKKVLVPINSLVVEEQEFIDYESAMNAAIQIFETPQLIEWEVIVRYNQGLGIEYKNLPSISARDKEEAKKLAFDYAETVFSPLVQINEIKVRPKK